MHRIVDSGFVFRESSFSLSTCSGDQESFGVAYRLLLDRAKVSYLIFRETEFLLPCEKASRALWAMLCGTHVLSMFNHRNLALIGSAGSSCDSFVALLGAKPDSACEHQCSGHCKNCLSHTLFEFSFELNLQRHPWPASRILPIV